MKIEDAEKIAERIYGFVKAYPDLDENTKKKIKGLYVNLILYENVCYICNVGFLLRTEFIPIGISRYEFKGMDWTVESLKGEILLKNKKEEMKIRMNELEKDFK
jgi:hypothetical protein